MYSPFWDKTITIYTPFVSQNTTQWYRHVISNVFIRYNADKVSEGNIYIPDKRTKYRIPSDKYLSPAEWRASSEKSSRWTLELESIIVMGKVSDTLEDNSSGTVLLDKYDCSKPYDITDNRYVYLPHISVLGDRYGRRSF